MTGGKTPEVGNTCAIASPVYAAMLGSSPGSPQHMQEKTLSTAGRLERLIGRVVRMERGEIPRLLLSFAFFFCVLAAYYVIRPVREEMGVVVGREWLQSLFVIVFFVMLAAVPLFGWGVSRFEKRRLGPGGCVFFLCSPAGFCCLMTVKGV